MVKTKHIVDLGKNPAIIIAGIAIVALGYFWFVNKCRIIPHPPFTWCGRSGPPDGGFDDSMNDAMYGTHY